jgi:hypothetical protein
MSDAAELKPLWAMVEEWRKQPEYQDKMPLSKEAQAVVFARVLCAGELEARLKAWAAKPEIFDSNGSDWIIERVLGLTSVGESR